MEFDDGGVQMIRRFLFILLTVSGTAYAQTCTVTSASASYANVNAVVNGPTHTAVNGDVICIASGTATWTSTLVVPSNIGITIIGSGSPNSTPSTTGASSSCASGTVITDDITTASAALISMSPTFGNATSRISCMELLPTTGSPGFGAPLQIAGTCTSSGCPNLRIDNITAPSTWAGDGISDDTFALVQNMYGVADHSSIGNGSSSTNGVDFINVSHGNWLGLGNWGDQSWNSADSLGTASQFYLENNAFNGAFGTDADAFGTGFGGGRFTCRFNTFANVTAASACTNHGTDTIDRTRGGRQMEFYGNSLTSCIGGACNTVTGSRSGVGIIWGNSFTGPFVNAFYSMDTKRRWAADTPWGACDGSSVWDVIDGTTYYSGTTGTSSGTDPITIPDSGSPGWTTNQWFSNGNPYSFHDVTLGWGYEIASNTSSVLTTGTTGGASGNGLPGTGNSYQILRATVCIDQVTRGAGLLVRDTTLGSGVPVLNSTGSAGSVAEPLDPVYEGAEYSGGTNPTHNEVSSDSASIIANRDFYQQNIGQVAQSNATTPFNGTSGTGYGTLVFRPTTCTTGVGYFATDQGSWNTSGVTFPNQSFTNGHLDICTSTNTWTTSYTPYSYPHPLTVAAANPTIDVLSGVTLKGATLQ